MQGFAPHLLLSDFNVSTVKISLTAGQIFSLESNADRFALFWWPNTMADYWIAPDPQILDGANGLKVSAGFNSSWFNFAHFGPLICGNWYILCTLGPTIYVNEVIYQPRLGD